VAALIATQREAHGIPHAVACRALEVSRSWFYKWAGGDRSAATAAAPLQDAGVNLTELSTHDVRLRTAGSSTRSRRAGCATPGSLS
jgi:hypothetical protein